MTAASPPPMANRVWIVTGANSGIGKATALGLARLGGTVVMACRSPTRGEAARAEIVRESGNPHVAVMIVDLASEASVRAFAEEFTRTYPRLDVLINNAGVYTSHREMTEDGLERQFEVNYLSEFLLTHLLLDPLKRSAPSRIVNVSSSAHEGGTIRFDDLQGEQRYGGFRAYNQSKLAQVLFTRELATRLVGSGVTVNACHPGVIRTNLGMGGASPIVRFVRMFFKSPEKGAETPIFLAASPEVEGVTGKYFAKMQVRTPSRAAQDASVARRLFDISAQLTHVTG
ncbi:MAG TPA: SDR family oxidoreductase [Thermoplasmata archaeon]|nr:SDR family oxidoreductase [Thermoplasmata archaeon]